MSHQRQKLNVINTSPVGDSATTEKAPELIQSAKRIARKQLASLLQSMFDNVDDFLFTLADKADNNHQQSFYFDTMRELRLRKDAMSQTYFQEFDRCFAGAMRGEFTAQHNRRNNNGISDVALGLSLVDDDDLEESLAVINMISKLQGLAREPLSAMAQRMAYVAEGHQFTSEENPLSPSLICRSFEAAVKTLDFDVKINLIIFKLFDKFVVHRVPWVYDEVNKMFVAAGILPIIKFKVPARSESALRRADYIENEVLPELQMDPAVHLAEQFAQQRQSGGVFESMQQLLMQQRMGVSAPQITPGSPDLLSSEHIASGGVPLSPVTSGGDACYVTGDILNGLSGIQRNYQYPTDVANNGLSADVVKINLIDKIREVTRDAEERTMGQKDSDTIDIVSMLFDFILDDVTLPDALKALVARLQIPMVKIAIVDKTFFSQKSHPARQLLNELAYSANCLSKGCRPEDDSVINKINDVVERVLSEFETDIGLFAELLSEFREFLAQETATNRLAEEMLEKTKETVAHEVSQRIKNHRIPEQVNNFLGGPWKEVLKTIGLRDGCEGIAWDMALKVADDLIWSVKPKLVIRERQHLSKLIPGILNGIQEGLILISYGQSAIDRLFDELEGLHHASLHYDVPSSDRGITDPTLTPYEGLDHPLTDDATESDIQYISTENDLTATLSGLEQLSDKQYDLFTNIEIGAWIEFEQKNSKARRGKLVWKCEFSGELTFVDRLYRLVADVAVKDLVTMLEQGMAKVVEDIPLFDRAVDAVITGMKQCLHARPQQQPALYTHQE